jgi:hypothetical protein
METEEPVQVVQERCGGLDVHKQLVQACALVGPPGGRVRREDRSFSTVVDGLLALLDWLMALGCTQVAMESSGVCCARSGRAATRAAATRARADQWVIPTSRERGVTEWDVRARRKVAARRRGAPVEPMQHGVPGPPRNPAVHDHRSRRSNASAGAASRATAAARDRAR